jgi:hypothetical protein
MRIQTFRNKKGLIYGGDPKRIECDKEGVLKIGTTEISVSPGEASIMPLLFHGSDGDHEATFTESNGLVYKLEKVAVRGGRIAPPTQTAVEIMELRYRLDQADAEMAALRKKIAELESQFDTSSLNFLIK